MKDLYIIGAGGFGREVAWIVERINKVKEEWKLKGFIDDNEAIHHTFEGGYEVFGGCDYLANLNDEAWVCCAVGNAIVREKIVRKLEDCHKLKWTTLIDPSVLLSERAEIGEGTIICAGTIITVDIRIGKHVIINLDCTIGHDDVIEDYVTIYPSVNVSGNVLVKKNAELGTGTQIIQGRKIGERTIVGAGSVVVKDLPDKCTAVGSPAKPIKYHE